MARQCRSASAWILKTRDLSLPSGSAQHAGRLARKSRKPGRFTYSKFHPRGWDIPAPAAGIIRGWTEPVKAVCDRRATAPVELPGERTREDGLDRTCPAKEMAAIGSRTHAWPGALTLRTLDHEGLTQPGPRLQMAPPGARRAIQHGSGLLDVEGAARSSRSAYAISGNPAQLHGGLRYSQSIPSMEFHDGCE